MYSVGCASPPPAPPGPPPPQHYIETSGIQWCSGGGDLALPGSPFGAGFDGACPLLPAAWSDATCVEECEAVCSNYSTCVGFTYYQPTGGSTPAKKLRSCCFRTGTVAYKPTCDGPSCTARCYQKAIPPPNPCSPILISDTSDPGITPDPALARRFHALGPHVEYWPTLSSPDWLNAESCAPPSCYNGTGNPAARCPCGQAPNETLTMFALLAHPETLISSAIAEAKKWNITGYNVDMEAPSPLGCDALPVVEFVNKLSAALAKEGVQTSYCIGGMDGNIELAQALNKTTMRTVPMSLYGGFDAGWQAEVAYWKAQGMGGKLGVGFCPTCYEPTGEPPADIARKFVASMEFDEIDMFAYGVGAEQSFAPYWKGMRDFLLGVEPTFNWTETTGIQWCSDGSSPDWTPTPPDPFGAGTDSDCPMAPASWALDKVVAACEKLCAPVDACLGFTLYPAARNGGKAGRNLTECCFRTGGVEDKPKCTTPTCQGTRCYQKNREGQADKRLVAPSR